MHKHDLDRVHFYSKEDLSGGYQLSKGEHILRNEIKYNSTDINEVLEFYNIKKYFDNNLFLRSWTKEETDNFKQKAIEYGKIVGHFFQT